MRGTGTLVIAFVLSLLGAGIVQNLLAVAFDAHEEFIIAILALVLFALIAAIAFGVALAANPTARGIDRTALTLLFITVVLAIFLAGWSWWDLRPEDGLGDDLAIIAEILLPWPIVIAVQWLFVRRRAVRLAAL